MQGILYEEPSVWLFLLVTCLMGGSAAWMTGRAVALTWRPYWHCIAAAFVLAWAVRFIHFALFEGSFASLHYWLIDFVVVVAIALLGYRTMRAGQMTTQYSWLYERVGPLTWREKQPPA